MKDSWQDLEAALRRIRVLPEGSKGISSIPLRKKAKRSATDEYFQNFWVGELQKMKLLTRKENLSYSTQEYLFVVKDTHNFTYGNEGSFVLEKPFVSGHFTYLCAGLY